MKPFLFPTFLVLCAFSACDRDDGVGADKTSNGGLGARPTPPSPAVATPAPGHAPAPSPKAPATPLP